MSKSLNQDLLSQLDRVEILRDELLNEVHNLTDTQINRSPANGKWTILQIIEHLVLGEDYVLGDISQLENAVLKKRKPYHFIRFYIVMGILSSSFKVKAPSKKMYPTSKYSLDELSIRWKNNHSLLRTYFENLTTKTRNKAVFFHPITGPLKPKKALNLLEVHLHRHRKQIQELAKS